MLSCIHYVGDPLQLPHWLRRNSSLLIETAERFTRNVIPNFLRLQYIQHIAKIQKYNVDDLHIGKLLTKFSGLTYATLLFVLLILPIVAVPISAYAANVDIGITSITANPANSVTVPSGCGSWCTTVTITVTFHNYGSSPVSNVGYAYDYRGFSEGLPQSSILSCPSAAGLTIPAFGDYVHQFTWFVAEDEAGTFGTSAYRFNAYVSPYCNTETNLSNNQYSIPYHVYLSTSTGTLSVDTSPVKGEVYVDGSDWGVAPQSRSNVVTGQRTVSFGSVNGYTTPSSQTVQVNAGQTTSVAGTYVQSPWKSGLISKIRNIKGQLKGVLDDDQYYLADTLYQYKLAMQYEWFDTAEKASDGVGLAVSIVNVGEGWTKLYDGIKAAGWSAKASADVLDVIGGEGADQIISVVGYINQMQDRNEVPTIQGTTDRHNFFAASGSLQNSLKSSSWGVSDIQNQIASDPRFRYSTASSQLASTLSDLESYINNYPGNDPPSGLDLNYLNNCLDQISNQITQIKNHQRTTIMLPNTKVTDFPDMYRMDQAITTELVNWKGGQAGSTIFSAGGTAIGIITLIGITTAPTGVGVVILLAVGTSVAFGGTSLGLGMISDKAKANSITALETQLGSLLGVTYSTAKAMQKISDFVKSSLTTLPTVPPSGSIQSITRASKNSVTVTLQNTGAVTNGYLTVQFSTLDGKTVQNVYEELTVGQGQTMTKTIVFKGLNWLQNIFGGTFNVNAEFNLGFRQVAIYGPIQVDLGGLFRYSYDSNMLDTEFSDWYGTPGTTNVPLSSVSYGDRLYLFGVNPSRSMWYKSMGHDGVWSGWQLIPGVTDKALYAVSYGGYLYLFGSDPGSGIWFNRMDSSGVWSGWTRISGASNRPFSAVSFYGRLYLFAVDTSGGMWVNTMDATGAWSGWQRINGVTDKPLAVVVFGDYIFLFGVDPSRHMWLNRMESDGVWSGWQLIPGAPVNLPLYAGAYDKLYLLVVDPAGRLWRNEMDSTGAWSGWIRLKGSTNKPLSCESFDNRVYLFGVSPSGQMWYAYTA
jgi:hypothetical protein